MVTKTGFTVFSIRVENRVVACLMQVVTKTGFTVFSIRVENRVGPDQMASPEAR